LDNAGKTTTVRRIKGLDIHEIAPTLGFNIDTFDYRGYRLNLWDVGGQSTIRSYWRNYFEQTDGLIWVVDAADRRRLRDCKTELESLLGAERLAGASLLILANKQDIPGAMSHEDIASALGLEAVTSRHWHIQSVSAVTGGGLAEAFDWLVDDIGSRIFLLD
jgi:ADP-ribosylation factor-like protein 2